MKERRKYLAIVTILFLLLSMSTFADNTAEAFKEIFKQAGQNGSNGIIENLIDAMYSGIMILFRGISVKITRCCGIILIVLTALDVARNVLMSIGKVDVAGMMKRLMPNLIRNMIVITILTTKYSYRGSLAFQSGNQVVQGTLYTQIIENLFGGFMKLGLKFFGNALNAGNLTIGQIGGLFVTGPLTLLQKSFSIFTVWNVPVLIIKVVLLVFCLFAASRIIAAFMGNIFVALIISIFSIFYIILYLFDATKELGNKGITNVVVQVVTAFMTVGMVGVCYQVMDIITQGDSIIQILTLGLMLFMLSQTCENITTLARSITSGGGLGASTSTSFSNLTKAFWSLFTASAVATADFADTASANFNSGMSESTSGTASGRIADGLKSMIMNSAAAQRLDDLGTSYKDSKAIRDLTKKLKAQGKTDKEIKAAINLIKNGQQAAAKAKNIERKAALAAKKGGGSAGMVSSLMTGLSIFGSNNFAEAGSMFRTMGERMKMKENEQGREEAYTKAQEFSKKAQKSMEDNSKLVDQLLNAKTVEERNRLQAEFTKQTAHQQQILNDATKAERSTSGVSIALNELGDNVKDMMNQINLSGQQNIDIQDSQFDLKEKQFGKDQMEKLNQAKKNADATEYTNKSKPHNFDRENNAEKPNGPQKDDRPNNGNNDNNNHNNNGNSHNNSNNNNGNNHNSTTHNIDNGNSYQGNNTSGPTQQNRPNNENNVNNGTNLNNVNTNRNVETKVSETSENVDTSGPKQKPRPNNGNKK